MGLRWSLWGGGVGVGGCQVGFGRGLGVTEPPPGGGPRAQFCEYLGGWGRAWV